SHPARQPLAALHAGGVRLGGLVQERLLPAGSLLAIIGPWPETRSSGRGPHPDGPDLPHALQRATVSGARRRASQRAETPAADPSSRAATGTTRGGRLLASY